MRLNEYHLRKKIRQVLKELFGIKDKKSGTTLQRALGGGSDYGGGGGGGGGGYGDYDDIYDDYNDAEDDDDEGDDED